MRYQVDVRLPYLVTSKVGGHYVEFRCFNPRLNKLQKFRVYKGFRKLKSKHEVEKHAEKIISNLTDNLKAGWRPWSDKIIFDYQDQTDYFQISELNGKDKNDNNHIRKYFSDFLEYKKADVKPKTFSSYQSKVRNFRAWLEKHGHDNKIIALIDQSIIREYMLFLINKRKLDKRTVAKYNQTLYVMFRYFKELRLIDENPVHHMPRAVKLVDKSSRPMTDEHMRIYLNYVAGEDPQLMLASLFQLLLLCRPNQELRLMKCQDVDLVKQVAFIRAETSKVNQRVVVMPVALVEIASKWHLDRYPGDYYIFGRGGKPGPDAVGVNYFNRKFSAVKKILDLPETYTFYSFKHTGAGKLMEAGASLAELMSHLGHKRFESTIKYVWRHFGERSEKISNFKPDFLNGLNL